MSNVPFGFTPPDPDDKGQPQNPFNMGDLGSALSQLGAMLQGMSNNPDTGRRELDGSHRRRPQGDRSRR